MLKMLTTQLTGKFQEIQKKESFHIEDAARALAQAIVGDGHIYWYGFGEMGGLMHEIKHGAEVLPKSKPYDDSVVLESIDRVVIASRFADHEEAMALAKKLQDDGVQVISLSAIRNEEHSLKQIADFHIDTMLDAPLLPLDMDKVGFPAVMTMFYAYYALYLTTKEILSEFDEE